MKPTVILAIDPGATGGIVELWPSGMLEAIAMPDDVELRDLIDEFKSNALLNDYRPVCYLELVGGYIAGNKLPGSAMFSFGDGYGYIRGLLAALRIETHLVRPQTWQAGIPGVRGGEKADRKRALKEHAARLFPEVKPTLKTADALCIADFARRELNRPQPQQMEIPAQP
jgi:hypothetical protein